MEWFALSSQRGHRREEDILVDRLDSTTSLSIRSEAGAEPTCQCQRQQDAKSVFAREDARCGIKDEKSFDENVGPTHEA
jgi:hypothetical protein